MLCLRVLADIVQRFLRQSEQRGFEFRRQVIAIADNLESDLDIVDRGKFLGEFLERRQKTLGFDIDGTEGKDDAAHIARVMAQLIRNGVEFFAQLAFFALGRQFLRDA